MSKTEAGFRISTEPKLRVFHADFKTKMISVLFQVLNASGQLVPTPSFNKGLSAEGRLKLKAQLQTLQLKSFTSLDKKPVLSCDVKLEDRLISFTPLEHDLSMKGRGYKVSSHPSLKVNMDGNVMDILNAIEDTFAKCQ